MSFTGELILCINKIIYICIYVYMYIRIYMTSCSSLKFYEIVTTSCIFLSSYISSIIIINQCVFVVLFNDMFNLWQCIDFFNILVVTSFHYICSIYIIFLQTCIFLYAHNMKKLYIFLWTKKIIMISIMFVK